MPGQVKRSRDVVDLTLDSSDVEQQPKRRTKRDPLQEIHKSEIQSNSEEDDIVDLTQFLENDYIAFIEVGRIGISVSVF